MERLDSPIVHFKQWYEDAQVRAGLDEPTAMHLATAGADGMPACRVVLLKSYDERGFCFFTNHESCKGNHLSENAQAALNLYWMGLKRQIRISGAVEHLSDAESDEYYNSRHRSSRLGAWASQQSRPMAHPQALQENMAALEAQYDGQEDIPRPPHWGGYRVVPSRIEFWEEREYRLHERLVYLRDGGAWNTEILFP